MHAMATFVSVEVDEDQAMMADAEEVTEVGGRRCSGAEEERRSLKMHTVSAQFERGPVAAARCHLRGAISQGSLCRTHVRGI